MRVFAARIGHASMSGVRAEVRSGGRADDEHAVGGAARGEVADAPTWVADAPADWAAVVMSLWAAAAPMGRDSLMDLLNLRVFSRYYYQELRTMIWELRDPLGRFLLGAILWLAVAARWFIRRGGRGV